MENDRVGLAEFTRETVGGSGRCLSRVGVRLAAAEPSTCDGIFAARSFDGRPISVRHRDWAFGVDGKRI
ncbi:hypothetical protein ACFQE6_19120 [Natrinema soli]|uniref:Uncharacterized protein n=1 Tax=Natrinema soli TaxID=1930624 RepID=A0ABD5SNY4_9EURY